jgi:hypothetical protein
MTIAHRYMIHSMSFPIYKEGWPVKVLTLTLFRRHEHTGQFIYEIVWSDELGFLCASKVLG